MPAILAVVFTAATHSLLFEHGRLHSAVLSQHYSELGDDVRGHLFAILGWLQIYRLCAAALAVTCAVWALFSVPRWVGIVSLAISLLAVLEAMVVG